MDKQQATKIEPNWPELIKQKRLALGESQTEFGKRFGVSHASVSDWERSVSEAPYAVTWWLHEQGADDGAN